jgi:hypothetical protein
MEILTVENSDTLRVSLMADERVRLWVERMVE